MKKVITYIFFVILICFCIPIIFTNKSVETIALNSVVENTENSELSLENYDYNQFNTIKLLHKATGEVEELKLDEYLCGVISAEMPASYEIEALKSQAIVARTYTLYKIVNSSPHGDEADICDSYECCQAWISKEDRFSKWAEGTQNENWNRILEAVNDTKGKVITYDGKIINAFFHANSGGKTEIPVNVWGGTNYPYLQVVETSGEDAYTQYNSQVELTIDEMVDKFKEKYEDIVVNMDDLFEEIKVLEYTESRKGKNFKGWKQGSSRHSSKECSRIKIN